MSVGRNASPDPARLDELAEVTRDYARYSKSTYGIAYVALGMAIAASVALDLAAHSFWAAPAYLLLPAAWLVFVRVARAYHQRHGAVVEPQPESERSRFRTHHGDSGCDRGHDRGTARASSVPTARAPHLAGKVGA